MKKAFLLSGSRSPEKVRESSRLEDGNEVEERCIKERKVPFARKRKAIKTQTSKEESLFQLQNEVRFVALTVPDYLLQGLWPSKIRGPSAGILTLFLLDSSISSKLFFLEVQ